MNDPVAQSEDRLSLAGERRIDEACIRFESALQAGQMATIEDHLGAAAEPGRSALLRELLRLEVEYRIRRGEQPTVDEYRSRFPTHADSISSWFPSEPTIGCAAPASAPTNWPIVPGYEILAELGRGAMGVVYKAHHLKFDRIVAVKMVRAASYSGIDHIQRFLAEARAVARLTNPNVVQIYEIGECNGLPYFSMEYVPGGSLADWLKGTPPSDMEAARLIEVIALAMHYTHGRGIVHRDLKPANILLTQKNIPKVADFGLAKFLSEGFTGTVSGTIFGTPSYMAPEQAMGRVKEIGPATDVYSLGAILYELLTGRPPFRGETTLETLRMVEEQTPQTPHVFNPRVDRALEAICLKCLQKTPADRYPTAEALADDLAAFLRGESVQAHSGTATRLLGAVLRETRYTEVMRLWSRIWMGLALNGCAVALMSSVLLWYDVRDYAPYFAIWTYKMLVDFLFGWLLRIRGGPSALPVEKQLVQIWIFFWISHYLTLWFFYRSGGDVVRFLPIIALETALVLGSMGAILGGSFYVTAMLCAVMAVLDALWLGAGQIFSVVVICPAFFWLGWKHSHGRSVG